MKNILSFETSCDDTATAIVNYQGKVLASSIYSQVAEHEPYGGVVPEIGSRAHIEQILPITRSVFEKAGLTPQDISAVAVTMAPGLVGPLLVGAQFAKGFALSQSIPLIPVHHTEGHIFSGYGEENFPKPPFLALVAAGGHTAIYKCLEDYKIITLGHTLDDAAGEAFDKIGRVLGLGYPAGKKINDLAMLGDKNRFSLPIAMRYEDNYNFSFSGLKTQCFNLLKNVELTKTNIQDFCASLQEAICLALCEKTVKAAKKEKITHIVIGGGVSANSRLREMLTQYCQKEKFSLFLPEKKLCTDNAVMIARAALAKGLKEAPLGVDVKSSLTIEQSALLLENN